MSGEPIPDFEDRFGLDQGLDETSWIEANPVYCPVPWCTAHDLARARCGDEGGPYEGLHHARIRYAKGQARRDAAEVERARAMGLSDPVLAVGLARLHQTSVDIGLSTGGRKGRRRLFPRGEA